MICQPLYSFFIIPRIITWHIIYLLVYYLFFPTVISPPEGVDSVMSTAVFQNLEESLVYRAQSMSGEEGMNGLLSELVGQNVWLSYVIDITYALGAVIWFFLVR